MEYLIQQQVIRTIVALCAVAAQTDSLDVRDDMRDEAAALVYLSGNSETEPIRRRCEILAARLGALALDETQLQSTILSAHAQILRLLAAFPVQVSKKSEPVPVRVPPHKPVGPAKNLASNQKKILGYVGEHPNIRTKEITDHFSGILSDRTVKRCLKDLVSAGVLMRTDIKGTGVVTYRVVLS